MSSPYETTDYVVKKPKSGFRWGCLLGGCLGIVLLGVLLMVGGGVGAYFIAKSQITKYTAEAPRPLPQVDLTPQQLQDVSQRVKDFQKAVEEDGATEKFILTADDINGLISQEKDLRGKVFLKIEDGKINAEVSVPTDSIPFGEGRYFNGSVSGNITLQDGQLSIHVDAAEVNNEPIPQAFLTPLREKNLAEDMNKDPKFSELLKKFEKIEVKDNQIILTPKSDPKN